MCPKTVEKIILQYGTISNGHSGKFQAADVEKAMRIVVDSKTDYPSACNAMETLLVHEELLTNGVFDKVCHRLKQSGVAIYAGIKQQHRNQSESNEALHDLVASQRYCSYHGV